MPRQSLQDRTIGLLQKTTLISFPKLWLRGFRTVSFLADIQIHRPCSVFDSDREWLEWFCCSHLMLLHTSGGHQHDGLLSSCIWHHSGFETGPYTSLYRFDSYCRAVDGKHAHHRKSHLVPQL